jgi:transposase
MEDSRKKYPREFKVGAVRRVLEDGQPQKRVAEELGISPNTLSSWKRQYLADPSQAFPGNGNLKPDDAEVAELRKELAKARQENEFLKKVAAFFAKLGK